MIAPPWAPVPPTGYGGTEGVIDRLARGLSRLGHEVVLCTTGDSTCPVARSSVLARSAPDRVGNALVEIRHVVHAYDLLQDMDVVHDHTAVGPLYAWRFPSLPVVTTNHGPFVAISKHQASTAVGGHVDAVIHHGLDPEAFPFGNGDGGYVLFLGRMAPEKGAREAALAARRAGVRLLMAAKLREPEEHAYFHQHIEPVLGDGVEYLGEVPHQEKLTLLAGAQALLNPIQWPEPFGLVMIEALACGTPVLAFPAGAAPEIVTDGHTGYLCADIDTMAARIKDTKTIDRRHCRAVVDAHFSTQRMCHDYLALYERIISARRAA